MMDAKKTILCLFLFFLSAAISSAVEDFNGYSGKQPVELCGCSDYEDSISIQNIGDETSAYRITLGGELKEEALLSRQSFSLSPGEQIAVNYAIANTCGKSGSYELIFDISTGTGIVKRMIIPVLIKKCKNIELSTKKNTAAICPCSQVKYQLELKNPGEFSESYSIDVSNPFKKWSKLTAKEITLAPGQQILLDFYLRPGCDVYGNYSSLFKATSKKTKLTAKMPLYLYISPCYEFNLTLGDYYFDDKKNKSLFKAHEGPYQLCEKEPKTMPILIENNAPIPNRFDLELEGEDWLELEGERVTLNAKNSTIIDLIAEPPGKLEGNYTFSIDAETYWGELEQEKEFNVSVELCYTPFIETDRIYVNYTKSVNEINLQNKGAKEARYLFNIIEKPDWISVSPANATLNPGENASITITLEPSEEVKQGHYALALNITIGEEGPGYEHTIIIKLDKKGFIGKSSDYLKQKAALVYEKTKGLFLTYKWYLLEGIAGLIVLLVIISVSRKKLAGRRERIAKEKIREIEKTKAAKEPKKAKKPKKEKEPIEIKIRINSLLKIILLVLAIAALSYVVFYFREYLFYFIRDIAIGIAAFALLAILISLFRSRKARKHLKEKWAFYLLALIIIAALFWLSYDIMPSLLKGNFSAITIYPGKFIEPEELNITGAPEEIPEEPEGQANISEEQPAEQLIISEELPEEKPNLGEKIYHYGKSSAEYLKKYSYYIGFGILALVLLITLLRFAAKSEKEIEDFVKEKKLPKEKKKKEAKKAEKTHKKKTDFYFILKILLWILVAAALFFAVSYFIDYIYFFIWYFAAGMAALFLLILIISALRDKRAKKHFSRAWRIYLLLLILILVLAGAYFCYKNRCYERPYNSSKEWISGFISGFYVTEEETAEPEEAKEAEIEIKEMPEEKIIEEKGPVISWNQDLEQVLDLNKYFNDPDNDKLYFSASQLENIEVEINDDGTAALRPGKGWSGMEKIVFTADDKKGGVIKSDEITLVVKSADKSAVESAGFIAKAKAVFIDYIYYIIIGFAILIIALFFFREKEYGSNKRKNSVKNSRRK